ncbi:ABC transporter permease [Candidatus Oleimmundimicrobium sp.]|uniref:ABC transporter permease n=1 Tax=Candidatus Oleimmundimicrobium sp. TaxID=3060597 RepID=UPI002720BA52|nr:ABC transporter permease [Candidatus Oleimmundimicrobium sp.]MDO8886666.1 ABC transporter permease [Candidatus Oleimmundimicrobium sp.]
MNILESFKVAIDSLLSNKMRSMLTMLGIIIGVSAVILLVSIGSGVQADISGQIMGLGSNIAMVMPGKIEMGPGDSGGPFGGEVVNKLEAEHAEDIKNGTQHVKNVLPTISGVVSVKYGNLSRTADLTGTTPEYPIAKNSPVEKGRFFTETDVEGLKRVCTIGQTVAEDFFGFRDPIGEKITISGQKFTVIGVMSKKGAGGMGMDMDNQVFIPVTVAQRILGTKNVSMILVQAKSQEDMDLAIKETERVLLKKLDENDFTVLAQEELLSTFQSMMGTLTLMLGGIAGISLLVGGIGIMNIMLVSVTERTREIGIRKAVGARTFDILSQFVIEAITLSVVGGVLGIIFGAVGSVVLGQFLPSSITFWSIALAFLFSFAVGIFFGVYPAFKASKLDPIEALRSE